MSHQKHSVKANLFYFGGIALVTSGMGLVAYVIVYQSVLGNILDPLDGIWSSLGMIGLSVVGGVLWAYGEILKEEL